MRPKYLKKESGTHRRLFTQPEPPTFTISDLLTEEMVKTCMDLYPDLNAIRKAVIVPHMDRINRVTGQENDPQYLAYCVCYLLSQYYN